MTTTVWPNGIYGSSTGEVLGTCKPLLVSNTSTPSVVFVSSVDGADENDGGDASRPKATLAAGISSAIGGGIVALLPNHNETITTQVSIGTSIIVVGLGSSGGIPTAKLTRNFDGVMLDMNGAGCGIRNVRFPASLQASASGRIVTSNNGINIADCYFDCGQYEQSMTVNLFTGTAYFRMSGCTFVSTSATAQGQPYSAITLSAVTDDVWISDCVVDGGSQGWGNYYAVDLDGHAITRLQIESMSLLRGSDMRINSATTGHVNTQTTTGSSKVLW